MQLFIEIIMALKFKAMGFEVIVLYDDGVLKHHETLTKLDKMSYVTYYPLRVKFTQWMLRKISIVSGLLYPYSKLNVTVKDKEVHELINNNFIYDGIDFFEYIEASLVRFFLSAPDDRTLRQEKDYHNAIYFFTKNALLSYRLAENCIDKFDPKLLITSHGIYTSWGVFMKKFLNSKTKVITYGGNGYVMNALDFAVNDIAACKSDHGYHQYIVNNFDKNSRNKIIKSVEKIMEERFSCLSGDGKKIKTHVGKSVGNSVEKVKLLKNKDKKVFAMFTGVMWDNATTFKEWNTVFKSPIEWLVETVKIFQNSEDKVLIIRAHPGECLWMNARVSVKDILLDYFGEKILRNPNILFISCDEKVISYEIFPYLDGAIVFNGTIGLELMYSNIPLVIGAKAAYSEKNFTYDLKNKDEYTEVFNNLSKIRSRQKSGNSSLKLFIYEYFLIHGVPIKLLSNVNSYEPNLEDKIEEIWNDKNLNHVISVINGEKEYFQEWDKHA